MLRPVIEIDEEKCDGCGQCVQDCAEGALAVIDGKARLISESCCDGLGACLRCPRGALRTVMRDAAAFDPAAALAAKALRERGRHETPPFSGENASPQAALTTWPIQLRLISPAAPYLTRANFLLAAHCAGFAVPDLHGAWLPGRVLLTACPKLEPQPELLSRLAAVFAAAQPAELTLLRMSVPCCGGLTRLAEKAMQEGGIRIPLREHVVRLSWPLPSDGPKKP